MIDNLRQKEVENENPKPFVIIRTTTPQSIASTVSKVIENIPKATKEIKETPRKGHGLRVPSDEFESFESNQQKLECYSCGSLLFPDKQCKIFNTSDPLQTQTCLDDEACLMYSWKKSNSDRGKDF